MPNHFDTDANDQKQGTHSDQLLRELATQGKIEPDTPLETDTGHQELAGQIPDLSTAAPSLPVPPAEWGPFITGSPVEDSTKFGKVLVVEDSAKFGKVLVSGNRKKWNAGWTGGIFWLCVTLLWFGLLTAFSGTIFFKMPILGGRVSSVVLTLLPFMVLVSFARAVGKSEITIWEHGITGKGLRASVVI